MRDVGADWDFADVRDHYLRELHGVTVEDSDYWERARHVTGELMAAVFGEWRRESSPCTGGIVLWLRDLVPGSGWGLLSSDGRPKLAWHHLRRAVAPVAVWFVDEGLNGLALHMANDTRAPIAATLRLSLYRNEELLVDEVETPVQLEPHSVREDDVEALLGRFVDVGYTYRFGEPQHDTVVATLIDDEPRDLEGVLLARGHRATCRRHRRRTWVARRGAPRRWLRSTCASSPPVSFEAFVSSRLGVVAGGRWVRSGAGAVDERAVNALRAGAVQLTALNLVGSLDVTVA